MDDDPTRNLLVPRLHPQSLMGRSPNDGTSLYGNVYDKDINLMRKLMNLDELQGGSGSVTGPNSDINAPKQFHSFTNGATFNGAKFSNIATFSFPFDKQQNPSQQQQQQLMNGMRAHHDGLLKPCYDFPPTKQEQGIDDNTSFGSNPIANNSSSSNNNNNSSNNNNNSSSSNNKKQSTTTMFSSGGFMNQFSHESLFDANDNHHHHHHHLPHLPHHHHHHQSMSFHSKMSEINNNNNNNNSNINNNNNSNGGIVIKIEHSEQQQQQQMCQRSSTTVNNKIEPNEFRNNNIKIDNVDNLNDDERKLQDESNDGFTQL
jgi:hypothetical protein